MFSIVVLSVFALSLRGALPSPESIRSLETRLREVDLGAFLNLTSTEETLFLRTALSQSTFRRVERQRVRVTVKYLRALALNAKILMQIGDLARRQTDPPLAAAGQELVETALRTRLLIMMAIFRLASHYAFPNLSSAPTRRLFADYSELKRRFSMLNAARASEYSLH